MFCEYFGLLFHTIVLFCEYFWPFILYNCSVLRMFPFVFCEPMFLNVMYAFVSAKYTACVVLLHLRFQARSDTAESGSRQEQPIFVLVRFLFVLFFTKHFFFVFHVFCYALSNHFLLSVLFCFLWKCETCSSFTSALRRESGAYVVHSRAVAGSSENVFSFSFSFMRNASFI